MAVVFTASVNDVNCADEPRGTCLAHGVIAITFWLIERAESERGPLESR